MSRSVRLPSHLTFQASRSWTDDLPVCKQSGVGSATNQVYRKDGCREEEHSFEDRFFRCQIDDSTYLYGVFDGHEGSKTAAFALQKMAAEILLGQLTGKTSDEEIKDVLRQAFISVEKGYFDSIDELLAQRTSVQYEIPEGLTSYEVEQNYPYIIEKLKALNYELSSGTTAVVALITNGKLYVANVGNSRALLCKTDQNSVLRVVQLSVDHDLENEDELLRLSQLGINVNRLRNGSHLGNQENTRCLGNYLIKSSYREFDELSEATGEPVIAEPEIHGGIVLDESCRFLLLMSDGLYKSLMEARDTTNEQINKDIAHMVVEQFRVESTLNGVAQAVVDKTIRIHQDRNMSEPSVSKRDDITLLVRNFNFPLPNAIVSPTNPTVRINPIIQMISQDTLTNSGIGAISDTSQNDSSHNSSNVTLNLDMNSETNTTSSSDVYQNSNSSNLVFGSDQRIMPYVDFSNYYRNVEIAKQNGTLPEGIDFD